MAKERRKKKLPQMEKRYAELLWLYTDFNVCSYIMEMETEKWASRFQTE